MDQQAPDRAVIDAALRVRQRSLARRNRTAPPGEVVATIESDFLDFHRKNPQVYMGLVALARQMKQSGRAHYGIKSLFEVLRWHSALMSADDMGFKLNNNFTSRFARLIMDLEPDLAGFFWTRDLIAL